MHYCEKILIVTYQELHFGVRMNAFTEYQTVYIQKQPRALLPHLGKYVFYELEILSKSLVR